MNGVAPLLAPGTLLRGKYRVLALAGGGGMSSVYRVEALGRPGQPCALKELRPTARTGAERSEMQQLFRQEAALLQRLRHPNLPQVIDAFDEGGRSYQVIEFIEGDALDTLIKDAPLGLPEPEVLRWAVQLCQVLDYLHTQKPPIIFRDLKPGNIMRTRAGVIKLIDFGIARTYKQGKKKDTIAMGTDYYAPREQYGQGQTDARSDIYALGATLYHLVTGTPPRQSLLPDPLRPPSQLNTALSPPAEAVILRAMQLLPADRYQSAKEMGAALNKVLGATPGNGPTPPPQPSASGKRCPTCGNLLRPQARFCGRCGSHLGGRLQGMLQLCGPAGPMWEMPLGKTPFLIGRQQRERGIYPDLDLSTYDSDYISRSHAQIIQHVTGEYAILDLGSANGTLVNGAPLAPPSPAHLAEWRPHRDRARAAHLSPDALARRVD